MIVADELVRALRWLLLYLVGIVFIAVVHTIQHKDRAWTTTKTNAWKRTTFFLIISWLFGKLFVKINSLKVHVLVSPNLSFGLLYEHSSSLWRILLLEVVPFTLLEDALFYWSHRTWHSHPLLYRHVHSFHHQTHKDVSLVNGLQVTFVEYLFSMILPGRNNFPRPNFKDGFLYCLFQ